MIWGCFAVHGIKNLYRVDGIMVKEWYENILEEHMLPCAQKVFHAETYVFQQDKHPNYPFNVINAWYITHK